MGKNPGLGIALAVVGAFATACGYTLQKLAHRRAEQSAAEAAIVSGRAARSRSASASDAAAGDEDGQPAPRSKRRRGDRDDAPVGDIEAITEASDFGGSGDSTMTERRRSPTSSQQQQVQPSPRSPLSSSSSLSPLDPPLGPSPPPGSAVTATGSLPAPSPGSTSGTSGTSGSDGVVSLAPAVVSRSSRASSSDSSSAGSTTTSRHLTHQHQPAHLHGKGKPYFRFWQFTAGLVMLIIGSIIAVVTFGLAGQAELAPMSAVTLVWSELLAWRVLKEKFGRIDAASVLLMSLGTTIALVFAERSKSAVSYDLQSILDLLDRPTVFVYVSISAVAIAVCVVISSRLGKKKPIELSRVQQSLDAFCRAVVGGLLGGFTGFLVKSLVEVFFRALSTGHWGSFERFEFYFILAGMVLVLFNQLRFLNRGLARYDSSRIIPLYQSTLVFSGSLSGLLLWDELSYQTTLSLTLFGVGVCTTIAGVAILSLKPAITLPQPLPSQSRPASVHDAAGTEGVVGAEGASARAIGLASTSAEGEGDAELVEDAEAAEAEQKAERQRQQHVSAVTRTFETIEVLAGAVGGQSIDPNLTENLELETGRAAEDDDEKEEGNDGGIFAREDVLGDDERTPLSSLAASFPAFPSLAAAKAAVGVSKVIRSPPPHLATSSRMREPATGGANDGRTDAGSGLGRRRAVAALPSSASAALASSSRRSALSQSTAADARKTSAQSGGSTRMADGRDHHFRSASSVSSSLEEVGSGDDEKRSRERALQSDLELRGKANDDSEKRGLLAKTRAP